MKFLLFLLAVILVNVAVSVSIPDPAPKPAPGFAPHYDPEQDLICGIIRLLEQYFEGNAKMKVKLDALSDQNCCNCAY